MKYGWDPVKELGPCDSCIEKDTSILVESIKIQEDSMKIKVNQRQHLQVLIKPTNASNPKLQWKSNDTTVAYVDPTGLVNATSKGGRCIITVSTTDGSNKSDNIFIKVDKPENLPTDIKVETINIPKSRGGITLKPNSEFKVEVEVMPKNATNKALKWESDNKRVATVYNDGTIRVKGTGDCTISVTPTDGGNAESKKIKVHVPELAPEITNNNKQINLPYGTWNGRSLNGKPDGKGTIVFNQEVLVADEILAYPGYTLKNAMFENGKLKFGTLYDKNGEKIQAIVSDIKL